MLPAMAGFQHTAARRRLESINTFNIIQSEVSTHSRPKAAGLLLSVNCLRESCFNTQPPEGGWSTKSATTRPTESFNTQPPEGGWPVLRTSHHLPRCFNTQPPEGGWGLAPFGAIPPQTFQHTAARRRLASEVDIYIGEGFLFQHTAARRRLALIKKMPFKPQMFQHTAARRRLVGSLWQRACRELFQHTAARRRLDISYFCSIRK